MAHDKLSHAVVLKGQKGVGKAHFSRALAQSIYCDNVLDQGWACGTCASCTQFEAQTIGDFRWIEPEDGASSISVDQIRGAIEFLELSRDKGRKKIAVISAAERLTVNAANSLLKTLEEPPGDTLILVLTDQPERLLITVRSRCQQFEIPCPSLESGQAWLASQGCDDGLLALEVSGNAPLAARDFSETGSDVAFHAVLESVLWNLSGARTSHEIIAIWHGMELEQLLIWMVLISEWMIRSYHGDAVLQRHMPELGDLARSITIREQLVRHDVLLEKKKQRGVSVNRDLVLDQLQVLWSLSGSQARQMDYRR